MENSPLLLAYTHARNAVVETHKSNPIAASEEHDLAAGEFANAAKSTADAEALRTLRLLEQHHQKLAEWLKYKPEDARPAVTTTTTAQAALEPAQPEPQAVPGILESSPRHISKHTPPSSQLHHRELSSSIASNLASARGIQPNRQRRGIQPPTGLSPQNAEGRISAPQRGPRTAPLRPSPLSSSRLRTSDPDLTQVYPSRTDIPAPIVSTNDDAFARFSSTFSSLSTRLSAALAFAGLPLIPESRPATPPAKEKHEPDSDPQPVSPEVTRLFSRAALRAVREDNGPGAESFYVVPITGGTKSYADMLAHTRYNSSALSAADSDEFVDAKESLTAPGSPDLARKRRERKGTMKEQAQGMNTRGARTVEELTIENSHLKALALNLSDRLQAFELHSQQQSIMAASVRNLASPTASVRGATANGAEREDKIRQLEEELEKTRTELKKVGRENRKLEGVVGKYREKFEMLKGNARDRIRREEAEGKGKDQAA